MLCILRYAALATLILAAGVPGPVRGAPTLLQNVRGYPRAGERLQHFTGLVFDQGKVVETGDADALHRAFPDAKVIDGGGKTLLPGLIEAHGHVLDLGLKGTEIELYDTASLEEAQSRI